MADPHHPPDLRGSQAPIPHSATMANTTTEAANMARNTPPVGPTSPPLAGGNALLNGSTAPAGHVSMAEITDNAAAAANSATVPDSANKAPRAGDVEGDGVDVPLSQKQRKKLKRERQAELAKAAEKARFVPGASSHASHSLPDTPSPRAGPAKVMSLVSAPSTSGGMLHALVPESSKGTANSDASGPAPPTGAATSPTPASAPPTAVANTDPAVPSPVVVKGKTPSSAAARPAAQVNTPSAPAPPAASSAVAAPTGTPAASNASTATAPAQTVQPTRSFGLLTQRTMALVEQMPPAPLKLWTEAHAKDLNDQKALAVRGDVPIGALLAFYDLQNFPQDIQDRVMKHMTSCPEYRKFVANGHINPACLMAAVLHLDGPLAELPEFMHAVLDKAKELVRVPPPPAQTVAALQSLVQQWRVEDREELVGLTHPIMKAFQDRFAATTQTNVDAVDAMRRECFAQFILIDMFANGWEEELASLKALRLDMASHNRAQIAAAVSAMQAEMNDKFDDRMQKDYIDKVIRPWFQKVANDLVNRFEGDLRQLQPRVEFAIDSHAELEADLKKRHNEIEEDIASLATHCEKSLETVDERQMANHSAMQARVDDLEQIVRRLDADRAAMQARDTRLEAQLSLMEEDSGHSARRIADLEAANRQLLVDVRDLQATCRSLQDANRDPRGAVAYRDVDPRYGGRPYGRGPYGDGPYGGGPQHGGGNGWDGYR